MNLISCALWAPTLYFAAEIPIQLWYPTGFKKIIKLKHNIEGTLVSSIFRNLFNNLRIKDTISVYAHDKVPIVDSMGSTLSPSSVILLNQNIIENNEIRTFLLKQHIYLIKSNAYLFCSALATVASIASTLCLYHLNILPCLGVLSCIASFLIGKKVYYIALRFFENKANEFAIEQAVNEELIVMKRFVNAQINVNRVMHVTYPKIFTMEGNAIRLTGYQDQRALTTFYQKINEQIQNKEIWAGITETATDRELELALEENHRNNYTKYNILPFLNFIPIHF